MRPLETPQEIVLRKHTVAAHMDIPEVKRRYRTIHGLKVNIITDLLTYWNL